MTTTPARRKLYAALHAAAAKAGLDDDAYRAMLAASTGKASAKELSDAQIRGVLDHLNGKDQPAAGRARDDSPTSRKIRALWLSLHHLGTVRNPSEEALATFVKGVAKVDALQWLSPRDAFRVIEALKDMAARNGVDFAAHPTPQAAFVTAQIAALRRALGDSDEFRRLEADAVKVVADACNGGKAVSKLTKMMAHLGERIRETRAGGGNVR